MSDRAVGMIVDLLKWLFFACLGVVGMAYALGWFDGDGQ